MMRILAVMGLLVAMPLSAAADCAKLEYSELKEMGRQDLNAEYCKNLRLADLALEQTVQVGNIKLMAETTACLEQNQRIERVFKARFKKAPVCKDKLKRLVADEQKQP